MEPYKITIHDLIHSTKRVVVFVGKVPANIRTELNKLEKNYALESKLLKKHYGAAWKKVLGINIITKSGGDNMDIEQFEALLAMPTETKLEGKALSLTFSEVEIFDFDKISEVKEKIYAATNILPFKQHLWVGSEVLAYKVLADIPINIDIKTHMELSTKIDNIPVNMQWYEASKSVKIEAYDEFKIISQYNSFSIDMVDLDSLLISNYKETEIIYYGFVSIFFPMIANHDVFVMWLKKNMHDLPLLNTDISALKQKLKIEASLINQMWDVPAKFQHQILAAITNSIITVNGSTKISIRNIFDKVRLSKLVYQCKVCLLYNGRILEFHKQIDDSPKIEEKIPFNSIMFKVRGDGKEHFDVIIFNNSTIVVKATWQEDYYFGFDEIFEIVHETTRDLFKQINEMNEFVFGPSNNRLPRFAKDTVRFSEIDICLFWKRPFSANDYNVFTSVLREFAQGGIIDPTDATYTEFSFRKGMFQFDPRRIEKMITLQNYYEHLTNGIVSQKWHTLFGKMRRTTIYQRFSDLKILVTGVREQEYVYLHKIIGLIMWIANTKLKTTKIQEPKGSIDEILQSRQRKALAELKERDPELYSSKRSDVKIPYSKICQKPFQPLILSEAELSKLKPQQKSRVINYFNFTTHKDAFYYCPSKKYPWIKFLVHRHPKGYCIPCCKKTQQDEGSKSDVHSDCIKNHVYTEEKMTTTEGSRYITSYGKPIDSGRLCHLPEGGLTKLLIGNIKLQQKMSVRCSSSNESSFYVMGISQNHPSRNNVGMMYCIADALNMPHNQFLEEVSLLAAKNTKKLKHTSLSTLNVADTAGIVNTVQSMHIDMDWNETFADLAFLFFDLYVMVLDDSGDGRLTIKIPSEITDMNRLIPPGYQTLIVIHNYANSTYYPVYEIMTDEYFRLGTIRQKTFANDNIIIKKFMKIMEQSLQIVSIGGMTVYDNFNLELAEKFFKITELYVNRSGSAYMFANEKGILFPIHDSSIKGSILKINIEPPKVYPKYSHVAAYLKAYNKWVYHMSRKVHNQTIYPVLEPELIITVKGNPIGFVANGLHFYCSKMAPLKLPTKEILYDPRDINETLSKNLPPVDDWRTLNSDAITRDVYLYRLFIVEVYYYFMKKKNVQIRGKLKKLVAQTNFSRSLDEFYKALDEIGDKKTIFDMAQSLGDQTKMLEAIDSTHFSFDEKELNDLKNEDQKTIQTLLKQKIKHLFKITTTKTEKIGNFLIPNTLELTKTQFEEFVEHLSYMLSSPTLQNNIFQWITTDNVINMLDFEYHPGEVIF